ncbi:MAG: TIGR04076 family protein [Spirochaetes bacterium]|nr:TIGR04076 family protein [Spirochaetota bacterium]
MEKCRITVIKKIINKDLLKEYGNQEYENLDECPYFRVGDQFIVEGHNKVPDGFCAWAWSDIQKDVTTILFNGTFPWTKEKGIGITCCTDGFMPVIFKVEKVSD